MRDHTGERALLLRWSADESGPVHVRSAARVVLEDLSAEEDRVQLLERRISELEIRLSVVLDEVDDDPEVVDGG